MNIHNNKTIRTILSEQKIPKMARVRQKLPDATLSDIPAAVRQALNRPEIIDAVKPDMSIAITAGSRGIEGMDIMLRETVHFVKALGGKPFLIPAMGSHGGAVAEGQAEILRQYGITEETMGAPIRATMETAYICDLPDGTPVCIDKYAKEADGIIVVNRIKPHTGFRGKYESGLFKIMAIGLGKQYGAQTVHGRGADRMGESIELFGNAILSHANILFGVATIENALDRPNTIVALTPREIIDREPEYLNLARSMMPQILFDNLDVVVVDYFGKEISGAGVDPNVTHTYKAASNISLEGRPRQVVVLDLSDGSHGNAHGVGVLDIITQRFVDKIDVGITYANSLTTGGTEVPKIPMFMENQELAIKAAIRSALGADRQNLRMVRIRDTMHLQDIEISEALMEEAKHNPNIEILEAPRELKFDKNGNLF